MIENKTRQSDCRTGYVFCGRRSDSSESLQSFALEILPLDVGSTHSTVDSLDSRHFDFVGIAVNYRLRIATLFQHSDTYNTVTKYDAATSK